MRALGAFVRKMRYLQKRFFTGLLLTAFCGRFYFSFIEMKAVGDGVLLRFRMRFANIRSNGKHATPRTRLLVGTPTAA
jgi:hypothetical protein